MDFTEFEILDYGMYYSTNVLDYFSKYVLACLIRASHTADNLIDAIEMTRKEAIRILGQDCFPKYLQGSIFRHVLARGHHLQTIGMLERFNIEYNTYRLYEALGYDVPADYYKLENMVELTLNSK